VEWYRVVIPNVQKVGVWYMFIYTHTLYDLKLCT